MCPEALVPDQVAEIVSPEFPGERLLVCLNPRPREERARKREALLEATEEILETIAQGLRRPGAPRRGRDWINRRVGREANRRKVEKHFHITVTDDALRWSRNREKVAAEARLDGLYVIRTSLDAVTMGPDAVVEAYKSLARVEQAFRSLKTTPDGFPFHSLKTLLADLATLTLNQVTLPTHPDQGFPLIAQPTPLQLKAFELLEIEPVKIVPSTMPA